MKTCFKCGLYKELSEFYVHPKMADGRLNKCKTCTRNDSEDRRKLKESTDPKWVALEADRHRKKSERYRLEGRASPVLQETKDAWAERNPEKIFAHTQVNNAIRDGRLTKQPCEVCGEEQVHAHHDNYSMPLNVRWLCPKHHSEEHRIHKLP